MNRKTKKRIDGECEVESFLTEKDRFGATYFHAASNLLGCGFSSLREEAESLAKEELILRMKEIIFQEEEKQNGTNV